MARNWQCFLEVLGWWEMKRCFNYQGGTVVLKPAADIVVLHPVGRFAQANTDSQWRDACFWTLVAHCNHGETCAETFRDADHLETFSDESVARLCQRFATATDEERQRVRMAPCPPHVAKAWHLGMARRSAAKDKRRSASRVASAMAPVQYIFVGEPADWRQMSWEVMLSGDKEEAAEAWRKAELRPVTASPDERDEAAIMEAEDDQKTADAMTRFMQKDLQWTHRELHDALLEAGVAVPASPSMRNYIAALYAQYGNADAGFLPQSFKTHTKAKLQAIIGILRRTGLKMGGKMSDRKPVLAERLAHWLNRVMAAGREVDEGASGDDGLATDDFGERARPQKALLVEHAASVGEIPQNAVITAEQAESALGRTAATELDIDMPDAVDGDTREEEEALAGRQVNPCGVDYACLTWQPLAPDSVSALAVGWESTRPGRRLVRDDFA